LNKDEYHALLEACDTKSELGRRDQLMLMVLYNTGVRVSELLGLKVKDIVKDSGGILVGVALLVDRTGGKLDFGSKTIAAYTTVATSYAAGDCPICAAGDMPLVKPGSRKI